MLGPRPADKAKSGPRLPPLPALRAWIWVLAQAPPHSTVPPLPPAPLKLLLLQCSHLPPLQREPLWSLLLNKEGDKWKHQDYGQHRLGLQGLEEVGHFQLWDGNEVTSKY